jgi:N-carbamoyl-L-amino-acid hydrolase
VPLYRPHAFVELHIEQGPVLDAEGILIGAVENLQGISWQELTIAGQSNHAGTTPMRLRHDAGYCAAAIATFVRSLARDMGGAQVCTVGRIDLVPNLINVIAARATLTADLRNTDELLLREAERRLDNFVATLGRDEGVTIRAKRLARFEPVTFDERVIGCIERVAATLGYPSRRMTSGAGHDAQMLARICPTAMIFVPSVKGISHNPAEHTAPPDLAAGANVLLQTILELADENASLPVEPEYPSGGRE